MEFRFKQFVVKQQNNVFKIGTDSVLLGAWTQLPKAQSVLELGTGTGVISLMLAQRFKARILAIDLQEAAVRLAQENFHHSPWSTQLVAAHNDFLLLDEQHLFDAIVSNPPYFENSLKSTNSSKMLARHLDHLPLPKMSEKVHQLLAPQGEFFVILPPNIFQRLQEELAQYAIFLAKKCLVRSFEHSEVIRVMGVFTRVSSPEVTEELYLYKNTARERSESYHLLTKEFYL